MGNYIRHLRHSLLASLAGVLIGACLGTLGCGAYSFVVGPMTGASLNDSASTALLMGLVACLAGIVPALLYGAPVYAALLHRGRANYLTVAVAGASPGLLLLLLDLGLGTVATIYGVAFAISTHFVGLRLGDLGPSANNSSKPTPLRGAA